MALGQNASTIMKPLHESSRCPYIGILGNILGSYNETTHFRYKKTLLALLGLDFGYVPIGSDASIVIAPVLHVDLIFLSILQDSKSAIIVIRVCHSCNVVKGKMTLVEFGLLPIYKQ